MEHEGDRLKAARIAAGFVTAADAARAMGLPESTYVGHENGSRGFARLAKRYASRFAVNLEWLMSGKGEMRPKSARELSSMQRIDVRGFIDAGDEVSKIEDRSYLSFSESVELPAAARLGALKVRGDSQRPRFLPGEYILYDMDARLPEEMIDRFAIVQLKGGEMLLKTIREGRGRHRWILESLNARPIHTSDILFVYRYCGLLPAKDD